MVSLKKYVACKCGANNYFDFSSDMSVEDLTISAKCPSCSANVQITISSLLSGWQQAQSPQQTLGETSSTSAAQEVIHDAQVSENIDTAIREIFKSPF